MIRIDPWDCWSLDSALSQIIHPALVQLKKQNHGYGRVERDDLPEHLKHLCDIVDSDYGDSHDPSYCFNEEAWNWVMDEMIYAFTPWDDEDFMKDEDKEHLKRSANGRRLFAAYYHSLWD